MNDIYSLYVPLLSVSTIITAGLGLYAWYHRAVPGATPFVLLMSIAVVWAGGYALEIASSAFGAKLFWSRVGGTATELAPVAWLVLALDYAGYKPWLRRRALIRLNILPLLTVLLTWTSTHHSLLFGGYDLIPLGSFLILIHTSLGPFYLVYMLYSLALIFATIYILVGEVRRVPVALAGQPTALLIGVTLPLLALIFDRPTTNPFYPLASTPLMFIPSGIVVAWSLFRHRLFDLVPVARSQVVENMADGVLVLDGQGRVVDCNLSARQLLRDCGALPAQLLGQPVTEVFRAWPDWLARYRTAGGARSELLVGTGATPRCYDVQTTPLMDQRRQITGYIVRLHDMTVRKQAEQEREALIAQLQEALASVKTLRGLIPICANCKKIRDDQGYWQAVEHYLSEHSDARFTHGICPDCMQKLYGELMNAPKPKDAPQAPKECLERYR